MSTVGTLKFNISEQIGGGYKAAFSYESDQPVWASLPVKHSQTLQGIYPSEDAAEEAADLAARDWLEKAHPCR